MPWRVERTEEVQQLWHVYANTRQKATDDNHECQSYLLSDLSEDAPWQQLQVGSQRAGLDHLLECLLFMGSTEEDVVLQSGVLNPSLLRHKCKGALQRETIEISQSASTSVKPLLHQALFAGKIRVLIWQKSKTASLNSSKVNFKWH